MKVGEGCSSLGHRGFEVDEVAGITHVFCTGARCPWVGYGNRNESDHTLRMRPNCLLNTTGAPVVTDQYSLFDFQRVHEANDVFANLGGLQRPARHKSVRVVSP
jgi:hypothetical protein